MPGREDLIKQNTARSETRARVENAGEQASEGGEKPTHSSHRSLLGGNLDVASALKSIEFALKGPLGDGALRNSIAYIRHWSRGGSKATAETAAQTVDATQLDPTADSQAQIHQQIRENYLLPRTLVESSAVDYLSDTYTFRDIRANERVGDSFTSGKLGSEVGIQSDVIPDTGIDPSTGYRPSGSNGWDPQTVQVGSKHQKDRQNALSTEIPRTDGSYFSPKNDLNTLFTSNLNLDLGITTNPRISGVGQLKPANPNGFVNTTSQKTKAISGSLGYTGIAGSSQGGKASLANSGTLAKGMWQFLFNPSELEIEAGPEFKVAEAWGVSEKGNSGQPLNWSHNKNAQLKFNSVLLNGFVFGRKVEELEQGIFELFMARDGEGQAGPPILEFVWGKRVFGPCVIKDISIKEKMWDEGEVVNAELSFTLEQIPEWTINDGYVDVARPGRIPMVYDPMQPNDATSPTTTTPTTTGDVPPGGGAESPSQKPSAPASQKPRDAKLCDWALKISKQFQELYVRVNNPLTAAAFGDFNAQVSKFYSLKGSLYSGSNDIGTYVDSKVASGCKKSSYQATTEDIKKNGGGFTLNGGLVSAEQQTVQFIRECTATTKRAVDEWHKTSAKCKAQRQAGQDYAKINGTKEQQELCAKYSGRCNEPGKKFGTAGQCPFVNNNRGVICSGGVWTPL